MHTTFGTGEIRQRERCVALDPHTKCPFKRIQGKILITPKLKQTNDENKKPRL